MNIICWDEYMLLFRAIALCSVVTIHSSLLLIRFHAAINVWVDLKLKWLFFADPLLSLYISILVLSVTVSSTSYRQSNQSWLSSSSTLMRCSAEWNRSQKTNTLPRGEFHLHQATRKIQLYRLQLYKEHSLSGWSQQKVKQLCENTFTGRYRK